MRALVQREKPIEVSWCAPSRGRPFLETGHGRCVVAERVDRVFPDIDLIGQQHVVPDAARLFKVGIGESAGGVGHRDQLRGDLRRKGLPPKEGSCRCEPYAPGPDTGRVVGSDTGRW